MILAGVLALPLYFGITFAYTWFQQNDLERRLAESSPQVTSPAAGPDADDLLPLDPGKEDTQETPPPTVVADAEAEGQAQLAAFRKAAETFAATVDGKPGEPIGKIVIPSIGVDLVAVEGTGKGDLKIGPGHWPETPFPGEGGNFVISGHRTTYGAPFLKLDKLQAGDQINIVLPYAVARYTVTRVKIVYPNEVETVIQRGYEQVSLIACHPLHSAKQRIVVQGELTSYKLISEQG
jgi:LPXTG-site transpeptidase (sortase) family protein